MLVCNLGASEVKVMVYHFQSCMAEYFTKREDIPAVHYVVHGKRVSATVPVRLISHL